MAKRFVKRLGDLVIDEVSSVDRTGNQYADILIAKRDEDAMPQLYDAEGNPVEQEDLQHGDFAYDEDGVEFIWVDPSNVDDGTTAAAQGDYESELEPEYEQEPERELALAGVGKRGRPAQRPAQRPTQRTAPVAKRGRRGMGETVLEQLSKALGDDERAEVIAKMADELDVTRRQAQVATSLVEKMQEEQDFARYTEIAKGYSLPIQPERLATIITAASETLSDDDLAEFDRLLTSTGEIYAELGSNGNMLNSSVMDAVSAQALEVVGKADGGLTPEQAVVALFSADADAYDAYIDEQRGY